MACPFGFSGPPPDGADGDISDCCSDDVLGGSRKVRRRGARRAQHGAGGQLRCAARRCALAAPVLRQEGGQHARQGAKGGRGQRAAQHRGLGRQARPARCCMCAWAAAWRAGRTVGGACSSQPRQPPPAAGRLAAGRGRPLQLRQRPRVMVCCTHAHLAAAARAHAAAACPRSPLLQHACSQAHLKLAPTPPRPSPTPPPGSFRTRSSQRRSSRRASRSCAPPRARASTRCLKRRASAWSSTLMTTTGRSTAASCRRGTVMLPASPACQVRCASGARRRTLRRPPRRRCSSRCGRRR